MPKITVKLQLAFFGHERLLARDTMVSSLKPSESTYVLLRQKHLSCVSQRKLFSIGSEQPGDAATSFSWNSKGTLLAIGGKKVCKLTQQQMACPRSPDRSTLVTARWLQRVVTIYDRNGALRAEISIPAPEFPCDERLPCINQLQVRLPAASLMGTSFLSEQQMCVASCKPLQFAAAARMSDTAGGCNAAVGRRG